MSAYSGLRNIILIGSLFGFHGLLNRSLLIDGVSEVFMSLQESQLLLFYLQYIALKNLVVKLTLIILSKVA